MLLWSLVQQLLVVCVGDVPKHRAQEVPCRDRRSKICCMLCVVHDGWAWLSPLCQCGAVRMIDVWYHNIAMHITGVHD